MARRHAGRLVISMSTTVKTALDVGYYVESDGQECINHRQRAISEHYIGTLDVSLSTLLL